MAETETKAPKSTGENAPAGGPSETTIALSEENLLALLGSSASPSSPVRVTTQAPSGTIPAVSLNEPQPSSQRTPLTVSPVRDAAAEPPVMTPNRAVPAGKTTLPRPASTGVDSTLALLAAIRENRAGALRSETAAKPVPPPSVATPPTPTPSDLASMTEPAPPAAEPPAKAQPSQLPTPVLPEPVPSPARLSSNSVAPVPLSITERIDRHPAIPISRNEPLATTPAPQRSVLHEPAKSVAAPASSPASVIDRLPGGHLTLLIVGGLIAVGGITTGLLLRSHRTAVPRATVATAPAPAAATSDFPLQLRIEPDGTQINVRWNPQSTLILQAREGRMVITENNQSPRTIALPLDQLKFGHLTYQPLTERVEFRLEVVDASGSVAEESVLSLSNPPARDSNPPAPVNPPSIPQAPSTMPVKTETPPASAVAEAPKASRPAARSFMPPTLSSKPTDSSIIDAPPQLNTNVAAPVSVASTQVLRTVAPPPVPSAPRHVQVESSLQAAKLIHRVTPVYPPLAKAARVQGTVHFKATISKDGAVQNLEMLNGPAILRQAAFDAVKQWKYQPTILNGQATEVLTSIDVTFTLSQ